MANHFAGPISSFLPAVHVPAMSSLWTGSQLWSWPEDLLWPIACGSVRMFLLGGVGGRSPSQIRTYLVEVRISGCAREHSFYNRVGMPRSPFLFYWSHSRNCFFLMFSLFCPQATNVHSPTEWKSLYSKLITSKYRPGITVCPVLELGAYAIISLGKNISRFSWECIWKYNRILLQSQAFRCWHASYQCCHPGQPSIFSEPISTLVKEEQIPSSRITLRIKWMNMQWIQTFGKP